MTIYVDADALVTAAKQILIKTANRTAISTVFVANKYIQLPPSPHLSAVVVQAGFDVADAYITEHAQANDGIITNDIVLADAAIEKGAWVLTMRGEILNKNNIKPKLNARDFMDTMRSTGVLQAAEMGHQSPYSEKDKKAFADALNKLLAMHTQA